MRSRLFRHTLATLAAVAMHTGVLLAATPAQAAPLGPPRDSGREHAVAGSGAGLVCTLCLAGGLIIVSAGGAGYALLVAEPAITAGAIAACVNACATAWKEKK
ncbi:MAG TPA: hypothetical protein VHH11_15655 [Gammaproteobacteria bacterium]|nr:hypothetical protein [Gammaproteobacteria bacterium]